MLRPDAICSFPEGDVACCFCLQEVLPICLYRKKFLPGCLYREKILPICFYRGGGVVAVCYDWARYFSNSFSGSGLE